jgi:hypothetical protein
MPRKSLLLTLSLTLVVVFAARQAAASDVIPAGTILQCTLDEPNFSSKTAMPGDPVLCHLGPLGSFGHSVFPRGAELGGHLEDAKDPGRLFGKGWMQVEFDRLILPGAQIVPVATKIISTPHLKVDKQGDIRGHGHPVRDAVEWMIPPLWPIKIITLPARGPYPAFKGETRLSLRLMEDFELPFPSARSIPMPPWASPNYRPSNYFPQSTPASLTQPVAQVVPVSYASTSAPVLQTSASSDKPMTLIALKEGTACLARQYWLQGGQLHWISDNSVERVLPLEKIDLEETARLSRERNVEFVLQSRDPAEQ